MHSWIHHLRHHQHRWTHREQRPLRPIVRSGVLRGDGEHLLTQFIQKMRTHENTSETLKTRACTIGHNLDSVSHQGNLVRFSIKDLQKDYKKTEDDIKAVQSVGQIIGEVMKQLDDDRCACTVSALPCMHSAFCQSSSRPLQDRDTSCLTAPLFLHTS